ncbi:MAG: hypothetical protein FJX29_03970 [Alphaproteobacteria bacterium]|nr:hypothetical protein [Alphaproteobacteria bacterium]
MYFTSVHESVRVPVSSPALQSPAAGPARRIVRFFAPQPGFGARMLRALAWTIGSLAAAWGTVHLLLNPPAFMLKSPERSRGAAHWIDVQRPFQLYELANPYFGTGSASFSARRHVGGGGRIDTKFLGDPARPAPWMQVEIYRFGKESARRAPLYNDLARQAARSGHSIVRYSQPRALATRFGDFDAVDLVLGAQGREPACAGFRLRADDPGLMISGVACGSPARPLDHKALACAIDRLSLVSAGDDRKLGEFFARAELLRRDGCNDARALARPAARPARPAAKPLWFETSAQAPALKGSLAGLRASQ